MESLEWFLGDLVAPSYAVSVATRKDGYDMIKEFPLVLRRDNHVKMLVGSQSSIFERNLMVHL